MEAPDGGAYPGISGDVELVGNTASHIDTIGISVGFSAHFDGTVSPGWGELTVTNRDTGETASSRWEAGDQNLNAYTGLELPCAEHGGCPNLPFEASLRTELGEAHDISVRGIIYDGEACGPLDAEVKLTLD